MNKKLEIDINSLSPEVLENLRELERKRLAGDNLEEDVLKGLQAIELAGKIMNSITKGSQIDPVFLKNMILDLKKNTDAKQATVERRVLKKKKLKLKDKN